MNKPGILERWIASPFFWCALLAIGLAARLRHYLFVHSYWYDESFLILPIRERGFAELLGPQPYNLVIPPFYLWLSRALFEIGGDGELIMRLPAFLAGIAAMVLMVPLSRRVVGNANAVWALAFLVVSRHIISHGSEVRTYTIDVLILECVLLCTTILLDPTSSHRTKIWSRCGLIALAAFGPWLSFPSAFSLGAASLALAVHQLRHKPKNGWLVWTAFNFTTAFSAMLLWWFSARHMYYEGMIEHWGHRGWGGFPDWSKPLAIGKWLLTRPLEIGNYGNRELGAVLSLFAIAGAVTLARRSRSLMLLFVTPYLLALVAALIGKYPLAHRTTLFLLPCLWLLAACGIGSLVEWGKSKGRELIFVGLILIAWDFTWLVIRTVKPFESTDYRGAYQYVLTHRESTDLLWPQMSVVYLTYHGTSDYLLRDDEFEQAVQMAKSQRIWVVCGETRTDLIDRFVQNGAQIKIQHHVSGLAVILFEPNNLYVDRVGLREP